MENTTDQFNNYYPNIVKDLICIYCKKPLIYDPRIGPLTWDIENAFSNWIFKDLENRIQFEDDYLLTVTKSNELCHETCYCKENDIICMHCGQKVITR